MKKNVKIGINYILEIPIEIYKILKKYGYLELIKFPGAKCTNEELEKFIEAAKELDVYVDIHGLPNMVPELHNRNFIDNVKWDEINKELFELKNSNYFSTHIGYNNNIVKEKIFDELNEKEVKQILINNVENIRKKFKEKFNKEMNIGGEMQAGGYNLDLRMLEPQFINKMWSEMDFGVIDITHIKLALKELKIDYNEYLDKLENREKVKICHLSGIGDRLDKDSHTLLSINEIEEVEKVLDIFNNIDTVISEYCFKYKYSRQKEMCIIMICLNRFIKHNEKIDKLYKFLEKELNEDCSNLEEIILNI